MPICLNRTLWLLQLLHGASPHMAGHDCPTQDYLGCSAPCLQMPFVAAPGLEPRNVGHVCLGNSKRQMEHECKWMRFSTQEVLKGENFQSRSRGFKLSSKVPCICLQGSPDISRTWYMNGHEVFDIYLVRNEARTFGVSSDHNRYGKRFICGSASWALPQWLCVSKIWAYWELLKMPAWLITFTMGNYTISIITLPDPVPSSSAFRALVASYLSLAAVNNWPA